MSNFLYLLDLLSVSVMHDALAPSFIIYINVYMCMYKSTRGVFK